MKKVRIILTAVLLAMSLTGCSTATEETLSTSGNSSETQAGTEKFTEAEVSETETEKSTETETEKSAETETTEAETEESTEATEAAEAETEESAAAEPSEVFPLNGPLGRYQSPEEFNSANFAASFDKDDLVKMEDGTFSLTVMIYRYELFSGDDISALKKGDMIWCLGEEVMIDTIEMADSGAVLINGGIENGGRILKTDDGGVYFEAGLNGRKSYYEIGENTYTLAENFVFTDNSDPDASVTYTAEEFFALASDDIGFINANTIVYTNDGMITAIERVYIP